MTVEAMTIEGLALPIVTALPEGCLMFTATDTGCAPLVRPGEEVAVDVTDREPEEGVLYLRRYSSSGKLALVEAKRLRTRQNPEGYWMLGPHQRFCCISAALKRGEQRVLHDGPFALEDMRSAIVGRVVAIVTNGDDDDVLSVHAAHTMERGAYTFIPLQ